MGKYPLKLESGELEEERNSTKTKVNLALFFEETKIPPNIKRDFIFYTGGNPFEEENSLIEVKITLKYKTQNFGRVYSTESFYIGRLIKEDQELYKIY